MNNSTTFFINPQPGLQFLSVFTYMNMLSDILYEKNLLKKEEQYQSFPIINVLYEYLNDADETKEKLVRQMLNGSNLYGAGENETLNEKYVDKTFEYIVSNVVFSQYGNIYGYLAKVISNASNLNSLSFKIEIYRQLDNVIDYNENGSISHLSVLTKLKIAETLIWPLFPRTKKRRSIIDIDYIYAQAGLLLARAANLNTSRIKFQKLIDISMPIESIIHDESLLECFFLPALLYYSHSEREIIRKKDFAIFIRSEKTWFDAFQKLFGYLSEFFGKINQKLEINNLYQFQFAMANYKSRTDLARGILKEHCPDENDFENSVRNYKTFPSITRCEGRGNILKNLNQVYSDQINDIRNKYTLLVKDFIQEAFDLANLTDLINSPSTTVVRGRVTPLMIIHYPIICEPYQPSVSENISLIMIRHDGREELYAVVLNSQNVTVMKYNDNREVFVKKLRLLPDTQFEAATFLTFLKYSSEDFEALKNRIAEEKGKFFAKQLYDLGYEVTTAESVFDVLLSLIPFYHCVRYTKDGQILEATLACLQDAVTLFPVAGELTKILLKLSDVMIQSSLKLSGAVLRTVSLRSVFRLSMKLGSSMTNFILTEKILKSLSLQIVQALDPGFQLSYNILRKGVQGFRRIISSLSKVKNNFPLFRFDIQRSRRIWMKMMANGRKQEMFPVVIDQIEGHDVFRYFHPKENKHYGERYISLANGNAEFKKMIGFSEEIPVVVSRVSRSGKVYYRRINLVTEVPEGIEWTLNRRNVLRPVPLPFREHIYKIATEGLSGRRKLKAERINQMNKALKMMTDGNKRISKDRAKVILQQYMLTVKREPILTGNVQPETINPTIQNFGATSFDPNDPNVLLEFFGKDYHVPEKVALNDYLLSAPTYEDFARDWLNKKPVDRIYKEWRIPNANEISKLIYKQWVSNEKVIQNIEKKKILKLYGDDINQHKLDDLCIDYMKYDVFEFATFQDFYAILLWKENNYGLKGLKEDVQLKIQMSLYKLTISQADEDYLQLPGTLFWVEMKDPLKLEEEMEKLKEGTLISNRFLFTTTDENVARGYLNTERFINNNGEIRKQVPVFYEINLNAKYLASNIYSIMPKDDKFPVALLPNKEFNVDEVGKKFINDKEIFHVKIHNTPVTKELALLEISRNIDTLQNKLFQLSVSKMSK